MCRLSGKVPQPRWIMHLCLYVRMEVLPCEVVGYMQDEQHIIQSLTERRRLERFVDRVLVAARDPCGLVNWTVDKKQHGMSSFLVSCHAMCTNALRRDMRDLLVRSTFVSSSLLLTLNANIHYYLVVRVLWTPRRPPVSCTGWYSKFDPR